MPRHTKFKKYRKKNFINKKSKITIQKANAFWGYMKEAALIPSKLDLQDWSKEEPQLQSVKDIFKNANKDR